MIKTTLKIEGMMCPMCEAHMTKAIKDAFKVKKAESSHERGETVIISREPLSGEKLAEAVQTAGYELKGITTENV